MDQLVKFLVSCGVLKTPRIIDALSKVDRIDFVSEKFKNLAYTDEVLPIGFGQTISQPYTVCFMLELLQPEKGNHILDVGSGSMWQSALLSEIVGESGKVYSIEINPNVFEIGKENISKYPKLLKRIDMYCQSGESGLPKVAENIDSFDGIIVAAEVNEVPQAWREQSKINGRLVYPKSGSVFLEIKKSDDDFEINEFPGFAFVPFIE